MKRTHRTSALLLVIGLGVAGCGARAGLDLDGPLPKVADDSGSPPPHDAAPPPEDALDAFTLDAPDAPDAPDTSLACAYRAPTRPYPLTGCGDLGPRIQDAVATSLDRQLPCAVEQEAFSCGSTPLSYADCEAFCLSDSFNLLSLNGSLVLSCSVWIYEGGAHELECDTMYSG